MRQGRFSNFRYFYMRQGPSAYTQQALDLAIPLSYVMVGVGPSLCVCKAPPIISARTYPEDWQTEYDTWADYNERTTGQRFTGD